MKHAKKQFSQCQSNPGPRPVGTGPSARIWRGAILAALKPVLLALCALLMAGAWEAQAQLPTANPPSLMTYQGYLVDANGAPLATNAPQNYDVIFRIYTASQGGSDLWSEQQTVTVDKGYFSVLLGQGSQYNGESHTNLAGLFAASDASDRYVQITVKGIGSGGKNAGGGGHQGFIGQVVGYAMRRIPMIVFMDYDWADIIKKHRGFTQINEFETVHTWDYSRDDYLKLQRSKSYVGDALSQKQLDNFMQKYGEILDQKFPEGIVKETLEYFYVSALKA